MSLLYPSLLRGTNQRDDELTLAGKVVLGGKTYYRTGLMLRDVAERGVTKLAAKSTETNSNSKIREGNSDSSLTSYLAY